MHFEPLSHPAPPRLLQLVSYARNAMPEHFTAEALGDCFVGPKGNLVEQTPVRNSGPVIGAPRHIVTGTLRRGWLGGCAGILADERFREQLASVNASAKRAENTDAAQP